MSKENRRNNNKNNNKNVSKEEEKMPILLSKNECVRYDLYVTYTNAFKMVIIPRQ